MTYRFEGDITEREATQLHALHAVLMEGVDDGVECTIYTFRDEHYGAILISEIDYVRKTPTGSAGAAWMRSDMDSFATIFAAENYLRCCLFPVNENEDPEQESRRSLLYFTRYDEKIADLPDWVERDSNPLIVELES